MNKSDQQKIAIFVGCLVLIAIAIDTQTVHQERGVSAQALGATIQSTTVPAVQQPVAPRPTPPIVSRPVVWPGDVPPTRIIRVPDVQHPSTGVMDVIFHPGDELEFDFEPLWTLTSKEDPASVECAVDNGDGFKPIKEYHELRAKEEDAGGAPGWTKRRVFRFHLVAGSQQQVSMKFVIDKMTADAAKPPAPLPPETFGALSVAVSRLKGINANNTAVSIDLNFANTSATNSIAVALHCLTPDISGAIPIKSTMIASDGTVYGCDQSQLAGIQILNANPKMLTEIRPGETRKVSLRYQSQWGTRDRVSSFKLQAELVVNSDYSENSYPPNFVPKPGDLPPNCKLFNAVFEIPAK